MTIDPLLSLLVGALGAALIGLLGAWIQSRREHSRWVREERITAYKELLGIAERFTEAYEVGTDQYRQQTADFMSAVSTVEFVGPTPVGHAGLKFMSAVLLLAQSRKNRDAAPVPLPADQSSVDKATATVVDTRQEFVRAAREALDIPL
jgi:hypothetical protein